jgi:tetratricopeptide (TPR) repeat protein
MMFNVNIYLRFAIIAVCLIGGILLTGAYGFWYAFPLWLIGLVMLIGYFLLGTIGSAAQIMQTNDFDATERRLNLTVAPRLLYATNRAYFYMMKGSIAQFRGQNDEAERLLNKAQEIKVPTGNEAAMIQLQLANIAAQKNKWNQAKLHLRNAKQADVTQQDIKEQIKQFEKAITNRGQNKAAMQMGGRRGQGGMRQGGKRRRPKMR